jgi:hypothetical protein
VGAIRGEPLDRRRYRERLGLRLQALARLAGPEAVAALERTDLATRVAALIDRAPGPPHQG